MRPVGRRALLAAMPAVALAGASASAAQMKILLGTAMEGGGVAAYGAALIDALKSVDPTAEIRSVTTGGILGNVSMLEAGDLDIALVFGEVAHDLFAGIGRPPTKLKVVSVMYSTPGMFVVRADSRYRRIGDLRGRPVVWNGRNGGLAVQARYVMDGLGLDIDKDFQPIYTERLSDGPPMVIEGRAAALWGGGLRWPGFVEVASSSRGARFVVPNAAEIEQIRAKYAFLMRLVVPGGLYPGQYDPIVTVGSWSFVLARADLDEAEGYRLAKALYRIERGGAFSRQLTQTTAKNTLAAIPSPDVLQPGVLKFYKEKELLQ
ncbi:MAG: TAXI family TRAP transporter solute-binding subunit [Reyranellales bacterium]